MRPIHAAPSLLALAAAIAAPAPQSAAAEGPRLALVVGNATYSALPPLPSCTASAHSVTAALKRAGFDVTERLDQSNGQMSGDLGALAASGPGAHPTSLVVYICGYAMNVEGRPFLLPVSATIDRDSDALTQGLIAKSVLDTVRRSGAAAGLVVLDAIAKPKSSEKLGFAALTGAASGEPVGLAAAAAAAIPPQGATPLATALAAALTPPNIETNAVVQTLAQRIGASGGTDLVTLAAPGWLAGAPAPAPVPATAPAAAAMPVATGTAAAAAFPDEAHMSDADRRRIQTALQKLGYYDGRVDGVFGADTRAAIRRFQHELHSEMTGKITPSEAGRLLASGG